MENSWQNFVKDLQISVNMTISNLNPHREYILKDNQNRKKVILTEIKLHNFTSPFDVMDQNYMREYYDTNLLIDQLKSIENIFNTTKSFPEIMDKKEKLELTKKIITQYLNYLVSKHFEQILNELVKELNRVWEKKYGKHVAAGRMYWNAGSLHIYERHFNILTSPETKANIDQYYENEEKLNKMLVK